MCFVLVLRLQFPFRGKISIYARTCVIFIYIFSSSKLEFPFRDKTLHSYENFREFFSSKTEISIPVCITARTNVDFSVLKLECLFRDKVSIHTERRLCNFPSFKLEFPFRDYFEAWDKSEHSLACFACRQELCLSKLYIHCSQSFVFLGRLHIKCVICVEPRNKMFTCNLMAFVRPAMTVAVDWTFNIK